MNFDVGYVKEMQTTRLLAHSLGNYCLIVNPARLVQELKALRIAGLWLFQAFLLNMCIFTDRRHNRSMGP